MPPDMQVLIDDLTGSDVAGLLQTHVDHMASLSPPESTHALDLESLRAPDVTFWAVREGGLLLGCGALKEIDPLHGEIKSMHTAQAARGRGVAKAVVETVLAEALRRSYERLSLETGSLAEFEAARNLYLGFGFEYCPPFADYVEDPYSVFMTLRIG
ncbi:GNAT family N-acetyltransferase [Hoeflea prorocentri]|uniref:GNAT family N-acetyltransferase n=1 Tax=Hoeflea prorocentri TaxID=1922333 RepID=A0A9X3ZGR2_9HYPH|nr:GNAT family N-acetyltransferase [Hoeflea prorocentri]MCY6381042.1 GNAT family N-acetyltransferase [Hoeflea prorocentri]MDA5398842.1 GNAT family N-acetyltransferase [Hoeflea prorocentri]